MYNPRYAVHVHVVFNLRVANASERQVQLLRLEISKQHADDIILIYARLVSSYRSSNRRE